jgi:hypothetical protein
VVGTTPKPVVGSYSNVGGLTVADWWTRLAQGSGEPEYGGRKGVLEGIFFQCLGGFSSEIVKARPRHDEMDQSYSLAYLFSLFTRHTFMPSLKKFIVSYPPHLECHITFIRTFEDYVHTVRFMVKT